MPPSAIDIKARSERQGGFRGSPFGTKLIWIHLCSVVRFRGEADMANDRATGMQGSRYSVNSPSFCRLESPRSLTH